MRLKHQWIACVILLVPCFELGWLAYTKLNEVSMADWQKVASHVRRAWRSQDTIQAAPTWMDPLLRWVLGDLLTIDKAAAADNAGFKRLWLVSYGKIPTESHPLTAPEFDRKFGQLRLQRWPLHTANKGFDFVDNVNAAAVSIVEAQQSKPCPLLTHAAASGGGLLSGPMAPATRFLCDSRRRWLWVGATVMEDLDFQPRRCIWQHPAGSEPIRVTFPEVRLAQSLVFYGGLYHMYERDLNRPAVTMRVLLDGIPVARFVHSDGDGWARYTISTENVRDVSSNVSIEVTADDPHYRAFCWSGYVQSASKVLHE